MKDQEFIVQKIRTQYTKKQHTELDELKALDAKVKKPANVFAYSYGAVGAVVMGAGMSLVMTDIGAMIGLSATMAPGIAVGVVGLGMALTTYPIYKKILGSRKKVRTPDPGTERKTDTEIMGEKRSFDSVFSLQTPNANKTLTLTC